MDCRVSARVSSLRRARTCAAASLLTLATFTVACSGHDKPATDDTGTAAAATVSPNGATPASTGKVHLEVIGGANAGAYDAPMKDGGCSYGLAGPGAWGNQYSIDAKDPKAFSSLQLIVPDAKAAAAGTTVFQLTAGFGPLFGTGATSYDINTRPTGVKAGSGRVTVDDHGTTGKVTFDAKTDAGVELKGTIDCTTVMRAS